MRASQRNTSDGAQRHVLRWRLEAGELRRQHDIGRSARTCRQHEQARLRLAKRGVYSVRQPERRVRALEIQRVKIDGDDAVDALKDAHDIAQVHRLSEL